MYIERVPNRNSPPAVLLRESHREDGKVKKRTLANLSSWPEDLVEGLRTLLKGGVAMARAEEAIRISRSLPHGHVAACLGSLRSLGLDRLLAKKPSRERDLAIALIVSRLINPCSKLATARELDETTAGSSLGVCLGLGKVDEDELYDALDWLEGQQARIEKGLAKRHLEDGCLVLYDVTSSYLEGRHCELAQFGYNRDGKKGKLQIVFGLITNKAGCPIAVEVFEGNTADPKTLSAQIFKIKKRFGLEKVVLVGDRGMVTQARIRDELRPAGLDWITALRAPEIAALVEAGPLQLSLFDERDLAEITSPDYPGERLVACRNPLLAEERSRKRGELLDATDANLAKVVAATKRKRSPLRGQDAIGLRVGQIIGKHKMAKHYELTITQDSFAFQRKEEAIAREAALDGIYVVRSSAIGQDLKAEETVAAYKSLSAVERAFRSIKTMDLKVRPIFHRRAKRVRGHVFLCMLAYYVQWHMRQALAPMLFEDHDKPAARARRTSIVERAKRSEAAEAKAASKKTDDGLPVHSFQTLLKDLATLARNTVTTTLNENYSFVLFTNPTEIQQKAFELLDVKPKM